MKPFKPEKPDRETKIYPMAIPAKIDLELSEISKATKIPKQDLIRQMIIHCLRTIEFEPISKKEQKNETDF